MSIVNTYHLYLNSKYRSSGSNNYANWELPTPYTKVNDGNYFECQVMAVDLPYSFKTINANNNILKVHITHDAINGDYQITLTEGNYNINNLLLELANQLKILCTSLTGNHCPDFTGFSYSQDTGRATLLIHRNNGGAYSITLYFTGVLGNDILGEILGFDGVNPVLSYDATGNNTSTNYISNSNVNVAIYSVYLRSDNLAQEPRNYERLVEDATTTSDILLKIPINSPFNSVILYENVDVVNRLVNKSIDHINLYLTTTSYDLIYFNNCHYAVHLKINEVMPDYVKEEMLNNIEKQKQIQALEQQKSDLLNQLQDLSGSIKQDIPQNQEQKTDANTSENVDQLKAQLLNEVQLNREINKSNLIL